MNPMGQPVQRKYWRFQIQGPNAWAIIEKLNGAPVEQLKFFRMSTMNIAGETRAHAAARHVRRAGPGDLGALRAPTTRSAKRSSRPARSSACVRAAAARTPPNTLESGWIPSPLPAVYTGDELRAYREWLPPTAWRPPNAIAGSFVSDDIEDYYLTPWELGLRGFIKYDHDFIGRSALEKMDPDDAAQEGDAGMEQRGPGWRSSRRCSSGTAWATSSSTCRSRTTATSISTRCSTHGGIARRALDVDGVQRQRGRGAVPRDDRSRTSRSGPR